MIGHEVVQLLLVVLFPPLCLVGVLGLGWLEDSLTRLRVRTDVADPTPILAVPVQRSGAVQIVDGSRPVSDSLGGTTNR